MTYLRCLLSFALLTAGVLLPAGINASSCPPVMQVRWGFLGLSTGEQGVEAPRNVAVVHNPELMDISSWPPITVPVVEHSVEGLWRPEAPLPPGTPLESIDQTVITTDVIDTKPPTGIELLSVSTGGDCGTLRVDVTASPSDDHTLFSRLVFAVYTGNTREEAMERASRNALYTRYSLFPDPGSPWVSIAVLDQAGNESVRSEAVEVVDASAGCSASGRAHRSSGALLLALALFVFAVTRLRASRS